MRDFRGQIVEVAIRHERDQGLLLVGQPQFPNDMRRNRPVRSRMYRAVSWFSSPTDRITLGEEQRFVMSTVALSSGPCAFFFAAPGRTQGQSNK